jgi:xanthine/CO dehydrogenase XdhC/CoxF family maturation factor
MSMNASQEFVQLFAAVQRLRARRTPEPAALATIVRTQGSTFRRAGASMLVHANGEVTCALAGGCPQRDIVERARRVMEERAPALVPYNRTSNLDLLMEVGCGGELDVFIEPLVQSRDFRFLDVLARLHDAREQGTVATVFSRDGAAAPRPWRLIRHASGHWTDIPSAPVAERVRAIADAAADGPAVVERAEVDGAQLEVLVETWRPKPALVVVGDGEAAIALAHLAHGLGWQVTAVHHVPGTPAPARLDGVAAWLHAGPEALPAALAFDRQTAVVVMTHHVERDLAYVEALAALPLGYLGVVGSRERARRIRDAVPHAATAIHAPAGLDIGSETPQEIALSIAAEIMAAMRARSAARLSQTQGPIHP